MKFLMMVGLPETSVTNYEAGNLGDPDLYVEMDKFNQSMKEAGVLVYGEGLHGTTLGAKVYFGDGFPTVTDGPWIESKELLGGYWVIEVKDKAEAISWATRAPMEKGDTLTLRQIADEADYTPENLLPTVSD